MVILDGPASGHATSMLRIPRAILGAVPAGPLARDARMMSDLLADPARTALVIVTRPEELPAEETAELARTARDELKIALGPVIVNAMPAGRLATEPVSSVLDRLGAVEGDAPLARTVAMATGLRAHRRTADTVLAALGRDPGLPLVTLPWLSSTDLGPPQIERLAAALAAAPPLTGER
jgi:anion-transporting  ArsA/GET3 family ATPase